MLKHFSTRMRCLIATIISALLVINVAMPVAAQAQTAPSPYDPFSHLDDAYSYAYGGLLDLRLLNQWLTIGENGRALTDAELRGVEQLWETVQHNGQPPKNSAIDVDLLGLIYINLGQISLPLLGQSGLLEFVLNDAQVGVLREYAHAPSAAHAHGASGVVSDSGGLELTQRGSGKSANVDILSLLKLGGSPLITDTVISEAALELGAVSAVAINPDDSEFTDYNVTCDPSLTATAIGTAESPEIICHGYQVADAIVVIDAPIVKTLMATITALLGDLDATINAALAKAGLLDGLLSTLTGLLKVLSLGTIDLNLSVTAQVPVADILDDLLNEELSDESGLVKIDLKEGVIKVDLQQLHTGGLNNLDPNTPLLTSDNINAITASVLSLLTDPATTNPNGLMAHLESVLIGDVDPVTGGNLRTGGLYDTALDITLTNPGLLGIGAGTLKVSGTLGQIFSGGFTYDGSGIFGPLGLALGAILNPLTAGVGAILEELLFDGPTSVVSTLLSSARDAALTQLVDVLDPVLRQVLAPLANVIINRQTTQEVAHGTVFTVSAVEVNVLELGTPGELIHLPLATASVMAQPPVTMDFDVAQVGDGRNLYTGGYTYDLLCTLGERTVVDKTGLQYAEDKVGDGFLYDLDELSLTGATGGLPQPVRITPGATCTVTGTAETLSTPYPALRPTGDGEGTRTPYTYFLDVDASDGVLVSGATPADGLTEMTPIPMTEAGEVSPDTDVGGDEWKSHTFTFEVPAGKPTHRVSIVHAYDVEARDIKLTKTVVGTVPEGETFTFQYSLDGGATWLPQEPEAPLTLVPGADPVTIEDIPVLDLAKLNADPSIVPNTEIMIREVLGSNADAQSVTWNLDDVELGGTYVSEATVQYAVVTFEAGPVADVATVPTPDMSMGVTNTYLEVSVDKHIDGLLDGIGTTTLLPFGEDEMTIRYTVATEDPSSVTLSDPSLNNDLFTLPAGVTVDPSTAKISGCLLTAVDGKEDTYSCEFTVSFTDPESHFHYQADDAIVTATVTKADGDRTITASDTDKHGAMRLSDLIGMLPATGVTTLVWVMALGLIAALTALALYVRSRRK